MENTVKKHETVLVCITNQINSQRLIDKAAEIAGEKQADRFHILHVQQGESILSDKNAPDMMHELCQYGDKKGGIMHFYCDEDIADCIGRFVKENDIDTVVIGQPLIENIKDVFALKEALRKIIWRIEGDIDIVVIPRNEDIENIHISLNIRP